MLHKNIRDIQTCLHQLDVSFDAAFEVINRSLNSSTANKDDIQNALMTIESSVQKLLWRREEIAKIKENVTKRLG